MNVEMTIQYMFDKYPSLFKERADCLDHLFCCVGNGYFWKDGELILIGADNIDMKSIAEKLVDGKAFQHNKLSLRAVEELFEKENIENGFYERFSKETAEKLIAAKQKYINELPDDEYYREPRRKRWYFYVNIPNREHIDYHKGLVYLWDVPDDIKPDWAAAIEECKQMLIEDGFEI